MNNLTIVNNEDEFKEFVSKLNRHELLELRDILDKEIYLSEKVIHEGYEKD